MVTVYYASFQGGSQLSNHFCFEPEPVYSTIVDDLGIDPAGNQSGLFRCPAFQDSYKKVYKVKATYDYELIWDGNSIRSKVYDQGYFDSCVLIRDNNSGLFSYLDPWLYLFSDADSLVVDLLPAIYEKKPIHKGLTITGEYDIAKHFRRLELAFILGEPQTISIKSGSPLYYIKFNTNKKINFKRFAMTPQLYDLQRSLLIYRDKTRKILPLSAYYYLVNKFYKKRFLKLIKENILE